MTTQAKPRVLYCCNAYPPRFIGGAELIVEKHARTLRNKGYDAGVFAGEGQETWGPHYALRKDQWNEVPVWRVQLACEDYANTAVNFIHRPVEERFEQVLDEFRPTVVHCHNLIGLSVQLLHLAKRRGLRTGLTLHDHWLYCPRNTLVSADGRACHPRTPCSCHPVFSHQGQCDLPVRFRADMMRRIVEDVDFFHFPSAYLRDAHLLWGLPADKCWVIPNGIELERFAGVRPQRQPGQVRLTLVSYLGEHKGVRLLVDAAAGTPESSRLFLNIVGEGELRQPMAERVAALGIADRVRFWGKVPNERINEVYQQTDCLVLPSLWPENHPVSINEALACGIPVIASQSGGIPELVRHCETGYLFEQGNRAELEQILSHIVRNPDCLDALSENARRDAKRLCLKQTIRRLISLYTDNKRAAAAHQSPQPITVACVGDRCNGVVNGLVNRLGASSLTSCVRLLWADWLYDTQLEGADVLWFTAGNGSTPRRDGLRRDAIWLLPEDCTQAGDLANGPYVLSYADELGAFAALDVLARRKNEPGDPRLPRLGFCLPELREGSTPCKEN